MTIPACLRFCSLGALAFALPLLTQLQAAGANTTSAPEGILQQELKQQQLRSTTQRVGDQLASIIGEFERNGISGEDVKVLRAIRGVLGKLTEKDMEKVIQFLQVARTTEDSKAASRNEADAYAGQKTIITQLKQLVLEYQRQQALYDISIRLKELANRQSANMWLGVWLAKTTEGRQLTAYDEGQKNNLRIQEIDQGNIKEEVALVLAQLEKIAKTITDGPIAERPKAALQQVKEGGVSPALDSAVEELKGGKLLSATGNEKKARDQLREIARLLTLSMDPAEALRQAIRDLDRAMDEQKATITQTKTVENKEEATKAETKQAEVVDATDQVRKEVESLAPVASESLKNATEKMQEARSALSTNKDAKKRKEEAGPKQEDALLNMSQARQALADQLAKTEENANAPENGLAALKELREQLKDLIQKEDKLKEETAATDKKELTSKAPRQGDLKDKAQDIQQKASSEVPAAAQSIGEAAAQMQKAQNSLANAQNNPAAQQAALDALQKAEQQLGDQIAALEKAEKDLAALEELRAKLENTIKEEQKVESTTAKEAVKDSKKPLNELAAKQDNLGKDTAQMQQQASELAPNAANSLATAKDHMGEAKKELDKPSAPAAQPEEKKALNDLYAAKKEVDQKMDELKNMLGQPTDPSAQALADAAAAIEKAQREVNEAMTQLQQSPPGLLESLQQQQQQIPNSLGQMTQETPGSKPASEDK